MLGLAGTVRLEGVSGRRRGEVEGGAGRGDFVGEEQGAGLLATEGALTYAGSKFGGKRR